MNKTESSNIIVGPKDTYDIPHESMGKYLYRMLEEKSSPKPIYVDPVNGVELTFSEILQRSLKCANIFSKLGLTSRDSVTIISENSINYCVYILAGLFNATAINPLNPGYTIGELRYTLGLVIPKVIICSEKEVENILEIKEDMSFVKHVILIGDRSEKYTNMQHLDEMIDNSTNVKFFQPIFVDSVEATALIMLSSGSTGLPKAVGLTHENLRLPIGHISDVSCLNHTEEDVTLLVVPTYHIYGMLVYLSGIVGSTKVIVLKKFQPVLFLDYIQQYKVTSLCVVPALVNFLVSDPRVENYNITSLKKILVAALPLGSELEKRTLERFPDITLKQIFGITEICGGCTFQTINLEKPGCAGSLGPGMLAKVYSIEKKENLEAMQVGELCFKSPSVMKGYINNYTDTKKAIDAYGFYHTGDLGYYDNDNQFYVVDRIKELIKYKGYQVSPTELEALLLTHPDIEDCGVVGIPDDRAGQLPFAFVVKTTNSELTKDEIIKYVAERISVQKHLSGGVQFIEKIPRNTNGKILRRELEKLRISN